MCLNSLLYKTERDLAEMSRLLDQPEDAAKWEEKARQRREKIDKYLWNAERGEFFDYNFIANEQSSYEYATTFYPLVGRTRLERTGEGCRGKSLPIRAARRTRHEPL